MPEATACLSASITPAWWSCSATATGRVYTWPHLSWCGVLSTRASTSTVSGVSPCSGSGGGCLLAGGGVVDSGGVYYSSGGVVCSVAGFRLSGSVGFAVCHGFSPWLETKKSRSVAGLWFVFNVSLNSYFRLLCPCFFGSRFICYSFKTR